MSDWHREQGEGEKVLRKWAEEDKDLRARISTLEQALKRANGLLERWLKYDEPDCGLILPSETRAHLSTREET